MQPGDRSMIPVRQTRYWRPTRSPLTRMTQSDAKPNRLTKYRSEPTTTRSNTAPDRASTGTSRSRDKARANNSSADLVTVMVRSLADPDNSSGAAPGRSIIPAARPARKGPASAVLRHYALHGCLGRSRIAFQLACALLVYGRIAALRAAPSRSARAPAGRPRSTPCLRCSPCSASAPAGSSGTTWRWRDPGGAPPEAIAGHGEFLGPAPGTSTDASAPQRERRCVGNPSRTGPGQDHRHQPDEGFTNGQPVAQAAALSPHCERSTDMDDERFLNSYHNASTP